MSTEVNLLLCGKIGTGKSSIGVRIESGYYLYAGNFGAYDVWTEDSYRKKVEFDGMSYMVNLVETSFNDEEYSALRDQYIRSSKGFFLVYSITDHTSFEIIDSFIDEILKVKDEDSVPMVLIGSKCDAEDKRQVMKEEGLELAEKRGIQFFEVSAKTGANITEALEALVLLCEGDSVPNINDNTEKKHKRKKENCLVQ